MAIISRRGRTARLREWRAQLRLRSTLERAVQRRLTAEFNRVARDAAEQYGLGRQAGVAIALAGHPGRVAGLLTVHHRRVFDAFGRQFMDEAKGYGGYERKDAEGFFAVAIERWLAEHGARKVVQISQTTRRNILAAILAGEDGGEGVPAIAKRIRDKTGGVIARARGLVIARTETHGAANAASDDAAKALGLENELRREWITADDNRRRDTHAAADGQVRAMDEPFDVGAAKLLRPGDPSGPPEEIILCRCVIGFVTPDEQSKEIQMPDRAVAGGGDDDVRLETKEFDCLESEMKALDGEEPGTFVGMGAVFGNRDFVNDVIAPGAFAKSLKAFARKNRLPPLLWSHNTDEPLGRFLEMEETSRGLKVTGKLNLKVQRAA